MFSREHWQIKLTYAGFGAFLLFIGMMLSPVTAQRDKFGDIECKSVSIVNHIGEKVVVLDSDDERGGSLEISDKNGKALVLLSSNNAGGYLALLDGKRMRIMVGLIPFLKEEVGHIYGVSIFDDSFNNVATIMEHKYGGSVHLSGKTGSKGKAIMGINEYGSGELGLFDRNGYWVK